MSTIDPLVADATQALSLLDRWSLNFGNARSQIDIAAVADILRGAIRRAEDAASERRRHSLALAELEGKRRGVSHAAILEVCKAVLS